MCSRGERSSACKEGEHVVLLENRQAIMEDTYYYDEDRFYQRLSGKTPLAFES